VEGEILKIKMIRHTLLCITGTAALIIAIATVAPAGSTGPFKTSTQAMLPSGGSTEEEKVSQLIVKPRARADARLASALQAFDASGLSKTANVSMTVFRPMSGDGYVIKLDQPVTLSEARVIAERLMRDDSSVEFAEPDRIMYPTATTPTDPHYLPYQWHYFAPAGTNLGGANLPDAWDVTKGSSSITVAVVDSGYRQHADLGPVLPGYDFITDITRANDGNGRDSDAQDPGDWVAANECGAGTPASDSSWHGTHVAGTIAALMNNSIGGTGVAPKIRLLPVRVLGKCGGPISDIADGMRWAAGLSVPGVPVNPSPAHVLNMSLGASGSCSATFQSAVGNIVKAGKVIVAGTGNNGTIIVGQPANCVGVIAVTAHSIDGDSPLYADVGTETTISAPGGDEFTGIFSLFNTGTTIPVADDYGIGYGTSMATPHAAGVVALMLSAKSSLTPAQVKSYLQSSARPHPAGTYCTTAQGIGLCGSGLLDGAGALYAIPAAPPTVVLTSPSQVVAPNTTISLAGSAIAEPPRIIKSYSWTQITGAPVGVINDANTASATFTSPATGTYSFMLTATDTTNRTGTATATVRVNSAPVLTAVAAQTVMVGGALNLTVGATDVDGDTPIFHSISLPAGATLSAQGAFSWPSANPAGSYTMTYYASDADANSAQGTVNITVVTSPSSNSGGGGGGGCSIFPEGKSKCESPLGTLFALFSPGIFLVVRRTIHRMQILP
jgi:serine protease